ncbi:MAG: thiamine pyrophosphate-dependent enzyme [Acidimicrobiales bacterium]
MPGMHGNFTAVNAMQEADLLVALGTRFDDRVTDGLDGVSPSTPRSSTSTSTRPSWARSSSARRPSWATRRLVIEDMVKCCRRSAVPTPSPGSQRLEATAVGLARALPLTYENVEAGEGHVKPQYVLERLRSLAPSDTIVASGVGQHQMWTSQYWKFNHPYTCVNSGGLGTMGFSIPAAIGAKVGRPDRMVWAVDGDGCFQMTAQELVTASAERIPIKVAILNNAYLGNIRQWQEMFYDERYSEVYLSPDLPDYVKWSEAMGCVAMRVESTDEVDAAIEKANSINDRPVVIEFPHRCTREGVRWCSAGKTNSEAAVDPTQQPDLDRLRSLGR